MADVYIDAARKDVSHPRLVSRLRALRLSGVLLYLALTLIFAAALAARLYNTNWDDGQHLHPDERHITLTSVAVALPSDPGAYFDTDKSPLNPYNRNVGSFVYGTFPLFTVKAVASLLDRDNYDQVVLVGRHMAAILDAATVLFVFLLGRRLYGALP